MLQILLVILGSAANFAGSAIYAKDTYLGHTKPNRITFVMWSLAPFIGSAAAIYENGWQWSVLPVFTAGLCPLTILICSFMTKEAYWKLHVSDYACGFLSLMALVLWQTTQQPSIAILFAILSDGLAAVPTLKKSWTNPETETPIAYIGGAIAPASSFLVIQTWAFSEVAFPAYLFAISFTIALTIYCRRPRLNDAGTRHG